MSKFIIGLDQTSVAKQIAMLLNKNNKLKHHYTSSKILSNNTSYCLELGGYNEKYIDTKRKIIGVIGKLPLSKEVTLIQHLCISEKYRNKGIATSLIKQAINSCATYYIQMKVRHDNIACLNLAERLGFLYIYHETVNDYHVLVLGREVSGKKN